MNWPKFILPAIFAASLPLLLFTTFATPFTANHISPKSDDNSQYLALINTLKTAGFLIHSAEINSLNQAKLSISPTGETTAITVYFDLNRPIEKQLMLLQKVIGIATIKLKHPYLIDFSGNKPYATLKNN